MTDKIVIVRKTVILLIGALLLVISGISFYTSRHLPEPVVISEGVTEVKKLSEYFPGIAGTANDCNIYILEGEEGGATLFVMGGSHPEEPAGRLATWLFAENAVMEKGRLILALSGNRSGTTVTRLSGAYPPDYTIPTAWGGQK
ncbi:succinylglutamate desuccinylase, partial [candidate division KSB1 bacterium]